MEPAELTGRYLVLLPEEAQDDGVELLEATTETKVREGDLSEPETMASADGEAGVVFRELGVAVLPTPPADAVRSLESAAADDQQPVLAVEPERYVYAIAVQAAAVGPWADDATGTWGLHATRADATRFDGTGIGVAILDTGIDLGHPDFAGRTIVGASFVQGQAVDDGNGHGTHCAGIACGVAVPSNGPRYGVASGADLHVGKVLSNAGRGTDGDIIAGIAWALHHRCEIVSMSLGARIPFGAPFSRVYEQIAQRALAQGTAIFAAAGNDNDRATGSPAPVSQPANCPSIFAVAAIDKRADVANFSNESDPAGGQVDVSGPCVDVRSTWPRPLAYRSISGTSMATPFVAGVAALHAERSGLRGRALVGAVLGSAVALPPLTPHDVGVGLVQAP